MSEQPTIITLPAGCRHWSTTATATSWEAWDALAEGWEERIWYVDRDGKAAHPADPDRAIHVEKRNSDMRIVVFPPLDGREERWSR